MNEKDSRRRRWNGRRDKDKFQEEGHGVVVSAFVINRNIEHVKVDKAKGVGDSDDNHTRAVEPKGDFKPLLGFLWKIHEIPFY